MFIGCNNTDNENNENLSEDSNNDEIVTDEIYPSFWAMANLRMREEPSTDSKEISIIIGHWVEVKDNTVFTFLLPDGFRSQGVSF